MHNAPAVSYPVGRSRFYGWLLAVVLAAGAGSLVVWVMQSDQPGWRYLAAAGLWVLTASLAIGAWFRSPVGLLTWDGKTWLWISGKQTWPVTLSTVLDTQRALLLYLHLSKDASLWIWPEQSAIPARWMALRRAVFAQQALETPDADGVSP